MQHPRTECLQSRYKLNGCVATALLYGMWVDQGTLSLCLAWRSTIVWCSWWKTLGSMLLSQNRFTKLTRITFLVFGLSINIPLMLLTSWLLAIYAQSVCCIMANHICIPLQHLSSRPSWSIIWGLAGEN